jgi:hypothetical protein
LNSLPFSNMGSDEVISWTAWLGKPGLGKRVERGWVFDQS